MNEELLLYLKSLGLSDKEISEISTEDNIKWANEYLDAFGTEQQVLKNTAHSLINAKHNKAQKDWEDRSANANKDYHHWFYGADDRWKASIKNETNPIIGLNRTVIPAVTTAASLYFLPQKIPGFFGSAFKLLRDPSKYIPAAANFMKGLAGYHLVEDGTKKLTGEGWADQVSNYTGWHPIVSSFTNPGTFAYKFPVKDIVKHGINFYKPLLKQINKDLTASKRVTDAIQTNNDLMQKSINKGYAAQRLYNDKLGAFFELQDKINRAFRKFDRAMYLPHDRKFPTPRYSTIDFDKVIVSLLLENLIAKYPLLKSYISYVDGVPYIANSNLNNSVVLGPKELPKLGTDEVITATIDNTFDELIPLSNFSTRNATDLPVKTINSDAYELPSNYLDLLNHNIQYIQKKIPGVVPFGSSVGALNAGLPTIANDYDFFITDKNFELFKKAHPSDNFQIKVQGNEKPLTYLYELENGKYGEAGDIDLNIIYTGKDGKAYGQRAMELFRLLFPDDYQLALLTAEKTNTPIQINKTPDELLNAVNPTKTVIDAFESTKPKHLARSLVYLQEGNPEVVGDAINKYFESFLGSQAKHVPVDVNQLTDPVKNLELLLQLKLPQVLNLQKIANDPKRMRNLLLLYWMLNSTYGRGISTLNFFEDGITHLTLMGGRGGLMMGGGLNTVLFGNSEFGPSYGVVQMNIPGINLNMSPFDIYKAVQRSLGIGVNLSDTQVMEINNILQDKYPQLSISKTPTPNDIKRIFDTLGYDSETVYKISSIMDINGFLSGNYGNSRYFGGVRKFDTPDDLIRWINTLHFGSKIYPIPLNYRLTTTQTKPNLHDVIDRFKHYRLHHLEDVRYQQRLLQDGLLLSIKDKYDKDLWHTYSELSNHFNRAYDLKQKRLNNMKDQILDNKYNFIHQWQLTPMYDLYRKRPESNNITYPFSGREDVERMKLLLDQKKYGDRAIPMSVINQIIRNKRQYNTNK